MHEREQEPPAVQINDETVVVPLDELKDLNPEPEEDSLDRQTSRKHGEIRF